MRRHVLGSATPRRLSGCGGRARPGERTARKQGQPRRSKLDPHRDYLLGLIEATPDLTISELLERLLGRARRDGQPRDAVDVSRPLRSDVQKKTAHASEQDRPDVQKRREDWFDGQLDLDPERLVFIDETWTTTNMARCGRGQRKASGCAPAFRTDIGKRRPSSPVCA